MRKWTLAAVAAAALAPAAAPRTGLAVTPGQVDTFEDGTTAGWFAGGGPGGGTPASPPAVVPDGGPGGAGDAYLQVTATGGGGPGSRLVAMNAGQWAGDYPGSGVGAVEMDLRNLGNSDLTIRLLFEDPGPAGPPANVAMTTTGHTLPAGGGWTHVVFPLSPGDLAASAGTAAGALSGNTRVRIFHAPDFGPPAVVVGTLGVDNITAVPEPSALALAGLAALVMSRLPRRRRW